MDYNTLMAGGALALTVLNLWRGWNELAKRQKEAGAKEEQDKNRDRKIEELRADVVEMRIVKEELLKVSIKLENLESSIEKLIFTLDRHVQEGK